MFKRLLLLLTPLFLVGCDVPQKSNTGADGYRFGPAEYKKDTVEVTLITHASKEEFDREASRQRVPGENVVAFAILYPSSNRCEVHIIDPMVEYVPEFAGHEFYHCFYGAWHE